MSRSGDGPTNQIQQAHAGSVAQAYYLGATTRSMGGLFVYGHDATVGAAPLVLDDTYDWRDRILTISFFLLNGLSGGIPGDNEQTCSPTGFGGIGIGLNGAILLSSSGWDGTSPRGGPLALSYANPIKYVDGTLDTGKQIYADSVTGALTLKANPGLWTFVYSITASEQLGYRVHVL